MPTLLVALSFDQLYPHYRDKAFGLTN